MPTAYNQTALDEFLAIKAIVPDEVNIYFILGKLYKAAGRRDEALKYFTTCLNLDPKASHLIKDTIEHIDEPDDDVLGHWTDLYKNMDTD